MMKFGSFAMKIDKLRNIVLYQTHSKYTDTKWKNEKSSIKMFSQLPEHKKQLEQFIEILKSVKLNCENPVFKNDEKKLKLPSTNTII